MFLNTRKKNPGKALIGLQTTGPRWLMIFFTLFFLLKPAISPAVYF